MMLIIMVNPCCNTNYPWSRCKNYLYAKALLHHFPQQKHCLNKACFIEEMMYDMIEFVVIDFRNKRIKRVKKLIPD